MKRSVFRRGILTLSLSVVLLGATAVSASAEVSLSPSSADYGNRQVNTTSPAQAFTLRTFCGGSQIGCLIFGTSFSPSIDVSGDFSQTNNCPPTLTTSSTTGVSCTINVTFTPTSTGPKQSALCTNSQAGETSCSSVPNPGPSATLTGNGVTFATPPTPPTPGTGTATTPSPAPPAPTCKGKTATIVGTNSNDVRKGTPGKDVIVGLGGNDKLSGLAGNDIICGGAGKDTLNGGAGKDQLSGQKGKDLCIGGKGNDTASKCEIEKSI